MHKAIIYHIEYAYDVPLKVVRNKIAHEFYSGCVNGHLIYLTMTVTKICVWNLSYEQIRHLIWDCSTRVSARRAYKCVCRQIWLCQVHVYSIGACSFWHRTKFKQSTFHLLFFTFAFRLHIQKNVKITHPAILLRSDLVGIIATSSQMRLFVWKSMVKRV